MLVLGFLLLLITIGYFGWQEFKSSKPLDTYIHEIMQQQNIDDAIEWENVILRKKIRYIWRAYINKLSFKVGGIHTFLSILFIDCAISVGAAIIADNYTILNPLYVGLTLFLLIFLLLFFTTLQDSSH